MTHRVRVLAATSLLALAAAAPADAALTGAGVRAGHNISVFSTIDFIGAFGYTVGAPMTVEVVRDGHRIASVTAPAGSTPDGGALEVNHGPLGAPQPGDCWEGFTPDVRPGDVVRVTADGGTDEVMVDNIRIDQGPTAQAGGAITMAGIAEHADGTPIPVAELVSGEVRNLSQFRATPSSVTRTPGTANGWTATFQPPFVVERNRSGLDPASGILTADVLLMGFGHVVPLPADTQIADGVGDTPGPALGCEASPGATNAIGTASTSSINAEALGAAAPDATLELAGPAGQDVTAATITLSDGASSITAPAAGLAAGAPDQQGWSATFTKAQIASLADGKLTASGSFTGAAGAVTGATRTIVKDTAAPAITTDLAPGEYLGTQKIALDAPGASRITYNVDGGTDTAYRGTPVEVGPGSHTLSVFAADAAGNAATASFAYTIDAIPTAAPVVTRPVTGPVGPVVVTDPRNRSLRIGSLRMRGKLRRAEVRRHGVKIAMRLASGTQVVRISIYRRTKSGFDLAARALRVPGKGGGYTVRLGDKAVRRAVSRPGRYIVEVTPGRAARRLSEDDSRSRSLLVVR